MKYISEFRDKQAARQVIQQIRESAKPDRSYRLMEFCGGHTHSLFRFGLMDVLPDNIKMLHGPGCPVCVLPIARIDAAIELANQPDVVLCSYGDMLRVPGTDKRSLLKAKSEGADVRMIYSPAEVITFAQQEPDKKFVFFAVGFETTTPPTALILEQCIKLNLTNVFIFCNHVLTPPAVRGILTQQPDHMPANKKSGPILDGLIGPGHVSIVTGTEAYKEIVEEYKVPIVISGFEPLDLLQSILKLVLLINDAKAEIDNQYIRAVTSAGNLKAQKLIHKYFELRPSFEWRGLGTMPKSAIKLRPDYAAFDAEEQIPLGKNHIQSKENKACECPAVLTGMKSPLDCKLFNNPCTPENPLGSCMVSSEGACAAYFNYHRPKDAHESSKEN